jgi:hypothetical protein
MAEVETDQLREAVEIRAAALAGDDRRLRALLDIVPPLRALHLQHVLHGTFT